MTHPPLYRKSPYRGLKIVLLAVILIYGVAAGYRKYFRFNPETLVTESVLKNKNFEVPVEEIVSPKYKIKAYWFYDNTTPIVSMSFLFKNAGYATDGAEEQGIAQLAAALLTEGAGGLDGQAFKEALAERAIGIAFSAGKDDFQGSLLTTRDNLSRAAELLALALGQPRFDTGDVSRLKQHFYEALKRQKEQPASVLALELNQKLYGAHPYARNPLGKAETIAAISRADLRRFVRDNLSRQNLIAGIAGDISREEAESLLDEVFGVLNDNGRINFVRDAEVDFSARRFEIKYPSGQIMSVKAARGVRRDDADFYPLFVANQILGGSGLTSRLSKEIREEKGLTYGVYSYLGLDDKSPLLMAGFASSPDKYREAERLFEEQWQKMGTAGVSAAELEQAKKYLTASYNLRFASIMTIADILTAMQKYNLGLDFLQKRNAYVQNVTLEEVNRAAKKYFDRSRLVSAAIGGFEN